MPELYEGVIYGYPRPDGSIFYVGQSRNLQKRRKEHLTESRPCLIPIDRYLRTLENPPEPVVLMRITSSTRQKLVDDLSFYETVLMFKHHTLVPWFPKDGGFNFRVPWPTDYETKGRIGCFIRNRIHGSPTTPAGRRKGGRAAGKQNWQRYGNFSTPEGRVKGGQTAGRLSRERGIGLFALTFEQRSINGRRAGKLSAAKFTAVQLAERGAKSGRAHRINGTGVCDPHINEQGRHDCWHTRRGILTSTCRLCCLILGVPFTPLTLEQRQQRSRELRQQWNHLHRHVNRGIRSLKCALCQKTSIEAAA